MQRDELLLLAAFVDWVAQEGFALATQYEPHPGKTRWRPITPAEAAELAARFMAACEPPAVGPDLGDLNSGYALVIDGAQESAPEPSP